MKRRIARIEHRLVEGIALFAVDTSPSPHDEALAASLLSDNERAEAAHFVKPDDRSRFVFRRAARRLLCDELGVSEQGLSYDENGKPLSGSHWPGISFSADDRCALLAFSRQFTLGVDIERLRPIDDIDGIARIAFSVAERGLLEAVPDILRARRFLEIWTLKEAWLKGRGLGLAGDVTRNCVAKAAAGQNSNVEGWRLSQLEIRPGYVAALAWREPNRPLAASEDD
jgi:4'-phosphopantetheinyl transferase